MSLEFYAYEQLGMDVFTKPVDDPKYLVRSLDGLYQGMELYVQDTMFSGGWWIVTVEGVTGQVAAASGEQIMASLTWNTGIEGVSPAHWVATSIGDIRALARADFS